MLQRTQKIRPFQSLAHGLIDGWERSNYLQWKLAVVYPLPLPLLVVGADLRASGPPASSSVTPAAESVHKSSGDNMVRVWVKLKNCGVCMGVTEGTRGDGCDLASTLCKYDLRKGALCVLSWARLRRVRRGGLFRADNVWWRCVQYVVIASCG